MEYKYIKNPLIELMAKQPPKDYRQRLWRRAVAQATEPTLTPHRANGTHPRLQAT